MEDSVEVQAEQAKMSSSVLVRRFPGPMGPVVGPNLMVLSIDRAADALYNSGFMRDWLVSQIKAHLEGGGSFVNKGASVAANEPAIVENGRALYLSVRSEYRRATEDELLNYVDTQEYANVTGKRVSARSQEKGYELFYQQGADIIASYDKLPKQAKIILDLMNETGRETFTEASIELILAENVEKLNTKQDPMKVFAFYRRRFIDEGHLEETE